MFLRAGGGILSRSVEGPQGLVQVVGANVELHRIWHTVLDKTPCYRTFCLRTLQVIKGLHGLVQVVGVNFKLQDLAH